MNSNAPVIVFGEGSASVFVIQELLKRNEFVVWVAGSGSHLLPVMPHLKSDAALSVLASAAQFAGLTVESPVEKGLCHRVFRSKAFKLPNWKKSEEQTWAPQLAYLAQEEYRIEGLDPALIEERLRKQFETETRITRVENAPVIEFELYSQGGKVQFANGLLTEFKQFYFCDDLSMLKGFPKLMPVMKAQMKGVKTGAKMGALQVLFHHSVPLKQWINRGLLIPMNRDSGETFERDVMGYFMEPTRSVWTVLLQPTECEENHEIMKKLRKLKQSLNRAFESPEFLPDGKKEFMATVEREQVRFEETAILTEGSLQSSSSNPDFILMTDTFGLSPALERIALHFGTKPIDFDTGVDTQESLPSTGHEETALESPSSL